MNFNADMLAKLRDATSLLQTEGPLAATAAIQRALHGMPMPGAATPPNGWANPAQSPNVMHDINPRTAEKVDAAVDGDNQPDFLKRFRKAFRHNWSGNLPGMPDIVDADVVEESGTAAAPGTFTAGSYANSAGKRAYKLYVPSTYRGQEGAALPLIVMLHGCKQSPDDFAVGTKMNQIAEEQNCLVLYPAQAQNANGSNCWNWFKTDDQQRGRGEPSIIAEMTQEIMRTYHVDPQRVYIAGLSAGGAMAAVMASTYPEMFAAVGLHSGLPHGAAHDMMSAFAAMRNGMPRSGSRQAYAGTDSARAPFQRSFSMVTATQPFIRETATRPWLNAWRIRLPRHRVPTIRAGAKSMRKKGLSRADTSLPGFFATIMTAMSLPNNGRFMAPAMPGPEAAARVLIPTRKARMPPAKCCDFLCSIEKPFNSEWPAIYFLFTSLRSQPMPT